MNVHNRDRRSGITGVWVALMGSLMVVFLGLTIDTSYVVRTIQELQTAADSAALAGAAQVKADIDAARAQAKLLAFSNTAGMTDGVRDEVVLALNSTNLPAGDIVTGRWYRWDDDTTDPPHSAGDFDTSAIEGINALKVVARRIDDADLEAQKTSLPLLFGPVFGWDTIDLEVDAIAMAAGTTGAGLLVLCPDCECALKFGGSIKLTLATAEGYGGDASIVVNSDASGCGTRKAAVCGSGGALKIYAPEINIHAEGSEPACFAGNPIVVPPLNPGSPRVPDPLADLPEPSIEDAEDLGCIGESGCSNTKTCAGGSDNGYHCNGSDDCAGGGLCGDTPALCVGGDNAGQICNGDGDCPTGSCLTTIWAHPGYYSGGFRMTSGNLRLVLDSGVYSLDNDGGPEAGLVINGGNLDATSGVMLHIVGDGVVELAGSGLIEIEAITEEGHLYEGVSLFQSRTNFADASIHGSNNMFLGDTYYFPENHVDLGGAGIAVGNQLIAHTLYMHGEGAFTINYDGRNPAPGYVTFLVE